MYKDDRFPPRQPSARGAGQKPACPTVRRRFLEKGEIGRDFAHNGMAFNKSKSESSAAAEAVSEAVTENAAPAEAPAETPTSSGDEGLSFWRQLFAFLVFVIIVVPVLVLIVSLFFGLILAEVEGWPIMDGFYYVTSMLCGLPAPLTDVEPDSTEGKIMDIIIAIWALAVAGTVIGVVGGMSFINVFIETAENAFAKKKQVQPDDEQFQEMTSGSETAELGNRVAALELAMRKQNDVLQKILAATAAK
jgi:hypothetical protein